MKSSLFESAPLLRIVIYLMSGILIGEFAGRLFPLMPVFVIVLAFTALLWRHEMLQSVGISLCFLLLGMHLIVSQKDALQVVWPDAEVCYEAVVLSEPVEKPKTMAVDVLIAGNGRKLKCYLLKDHRSRMLRIGDGLRIQSLIRPISEWRIGTFDYKWYMETHGFTGSTFVTGRKWQRAQVTLVSINRLDRTRIFFLKLRSRLLGRLRTHDGNADAYAVVAAMVLGDKTTLSKDLREVYSVTGASHVLALSGLHLGIIYMLLSWLLAGRRWQLPAMLAIILSVWAFVFLVGMTISVVRSAMMLTVYSLLSLGHRDKMSLNVLAFAAIVMLMANPLSLFDVGFLMSFAAVASILLFSPLFQGFLPQGYLLEHPLVRWVSSMVVVSLSAQVGVAPLIAYYFGRLSTFFLITNFIVIPAVTLILYGSLVVLLVPSLAYILLYSVSWLNVILGYISRLPGATIEMHPTPLQTVMVYVIIVACYLLIGRIVPKVGWSPSRKGL